MTDYTGWRSVPPNLATESRLKELDLPRSPGPAAGTVTASNWRGKQDTFVLYDIATCPPTTASAKQLESAAARRKFTACTDCGAHPDTGLSQVTGRCETCVHIEQLRKAQLNARRQRDKDAAWATRRIADPKTLVVWIDEHTPPAPPSGRKRNPVAHSLTAVTPHGKPVLRLSYRLKGIGPRVRSVPEGAVSYEQAAEQLAALGERYFITWTHGNLWHLVHLATGSSLSYLGREGAEMDVRVRWWRGDIDPRTADLRRPIPPGNADRLALLLRRLTTTAGEAEGGSSATLPTCDGCGMPETNCCCG